MNKENQKQSRKMICRGAHTIREYYYEWDNDDFNRWKQEVLSHTTDGSILDPLYCALYNTIKDLTWDEVLDDYLGKKQMTIHFNDGSKAKLADYLDAQVQSDTMKRSGITPKRSLNLKLYVENKHGKHLD